MRSHSRPLPFRTAVSSLTSVPGRHGSRVVRRAAIAQILEQRRLLCGTSLEGLLPAPEFSSAVERHVAAEKAASDSGSASSDSVTLVWSNRGQNAGVNNDYFDQVFGSNATKASAVIDAALADWSRAITSFNRPDGTTTLQINIAVNPTSAGNNAAAKPADTAPSDGLPHTGSITIDAGQDLHGSGYYIDDNPSDYSEFNSFTQNAFSGYPASNLGGDLYSAVSLEITHVLGLISPQTGSTATAGYRFNTVALAPGGMVTRTTIPDTDEGNNTGFFATFNGPTIKHLLTTNNGGSGGIDWGNPIHTAGAGGRLFFPSGTAFQPTTINGITYYPSDDTGNAKYESPRVLPSEVVLDILHDVYGYTIQDPHTLPNFFASLNTTSHVLTVRGAVGNGAADFRSSSPDVINVSQSGSSLIVSVDIGNDTPASGNLPGAGNLPAYVSTFNVADVSSIVIDGGGGDDNITVRGVRPMTVLGSDGNDTIRVTGAVGSNSVSVDGGAGNDTLYVGSTEPTLNDLNGPVTLTGGAGTDTITFQDSGEPYPDVYTLNATSFSRSAATGTVTFGETPEAIQIISGVGDSQFNVNGLAAGVALDINAGSGNDTITVGNGDLGTVLGSLALHGGGNGSDRIILNDAGQATGYSYTESATQLKRNGSSSTLTFDGFVSASIAGGSGSDTFFVTPAAAMTFYANGNNPTVAPGDTLSVALSGTTGGTQTGSGVGSGAWTFSNRLAVNYSGIETFTTTGGNSPPTITSLSPSSSSVTVGATVTLTANGVADPDNNLASVAFYRESNNTAGYQAGGDTLIGTDTNGGDGWSYAYSTSGLSPAIYTFYAVAMDAAAATSAAASTSVSVNGVTNAAPTVNSFGASPNPVAQGSTVTLAATASDPDGSVVGVNFYFESNGTPGLQFGSDTSYGTGSFSGGQWTTSLPTNALVVGNTYTVYALAVDNGGANSTIASATFTVTTANVPVVTDFYALPGTVGLNSNFALLSGTITDSAGTVTSVAFYKNTNGVAGLQIGSDTLLGTDTTSNDGWFLNPVNSGNTAGTFTYYEVATDNLGHVSAPASVNVSVQNEAPPTVTGATLYYNYAPINVALTFSVDVGTSVSASDLYVYNVATNAVITVDSVSYSSAGKLAQFNLHGIPPDGNYRAVLTAGSVTAPLGTPLASNYNFDFFILAGDTNHDRTVNFTDLLQVARHYGATNMAYGLGDFDYNNTVDFSDLLILARNYGKTLAAPAAPAAELPATATATSRKRPVEDVVA